MRFMLLFMLSIVPGFAQERLIEGRVGVGSYKMLSLKQFQEQSSMPFSLHTIDNFPIFPGFAVSGLAQWTARIKLGGMIGFSSTGGRVGQSDYSGFFYQDIICYGLSIAPAINFELFQLRELNFSLFAAGGIVLNNVKIAREISVTGYQDKTIMTYRSSNLFISPSFVARKKVKSFLFSGWVGFQIDNPGFLSRGDNDLMNGPSAVVAEWDGLRVGIGIGKTLGAHEGEN